jgi:hypothetical protein
VSVDEKFSGLKDHIANSNSQSPISKHERSLQAIMTNRKKRRCINT